MHTKFRAVAFPPWQWNNPLILTVVVLAILALALLFFVPSVAGA